MKSTDGSLQETSARSHRLSEGQLSQFTSFRCVNQDTVGLNRKGSIGSVSEQLYRVQKD
jgi:hypothetical protein